jgi:hypothetical protein
MAATQTHEFMRPTRATSSISWLSGKSLWVGVAGVLLLIILGNVASVAWRWGRPYLAGDPLANSPRVFFWAWERPENLEFLDPHEAGVAILVKTLTIENAGISARPRMQPVRLPAGITAIAAVRIETPSTTRVSFSAAIRKEAVRQILESGATVPAAAIQLDFDARASERDFYGDLLADLRSQLPPRIKLSITALASWCLYDDWISGLPVDESVPMLFRLGMDKAPVTRYLAASGDFRAAKTRFSVGISMDELPVKAPGGRRVYVFNPRPWTRDSVNEALRYVREWR